MRLQRLSTRSRPAVARRRSHASRLLPKVEGLEDRVVLSTMTASYPMAPAVVIAQNSIAQAPPAPQPGPRATPYAIAQASPASSHVVASANVHAHVHATTPTTRTTVLQLRINPIDLKLLGLEVRLYGKNTASPVTVTISAQPGSGKLLGNLLADVSGLINLQGVSNALNNVLGNVVTLVNQSNLHVNGVANSSGAFTSTTPILTAFVAPVHLDLLGAVVDTSPIHLQILAHAGSGLVLGNIVSDLANLLNTPPPHGTLTIKYVEQQLNMLLHELNVQLPNIPSAPTTPVKPPAGTDRILSLVLPPIRLNLLGLLLQTSTIQVNADARTGNGRLLGNLLVDVLNTLHATQSDLNTVNGELNGVLAKVVGVLNATNLILPANAVQNLSPTLQKLALPTLVNTSGGAVAPQEILNLVVASNNGGPPVDVDLLGVVVTTSDIQARLFAQPGNGKLLGNLVYNLSHLLDPGGLLDVLSILNVLGL